MRDALAPRERRDRPAESAVSSLEGSSLEEPSRDGPSCDGPSCDGIVCFAGVDWWYHNRGHSECHLMTRLARRLPVLWINSIGMRAPAPGRTELLFRRYLRKLRSTLKGLRRDPCGMWVYSPIFIPRYSEGMLRLNGRLLHLQVGRLLRKLRVKRPALWITIPTAVYAARARKWASVVFNRSDDFSAFPEANGPLIRGLETMLLEQADRVVYVNRLLFQREREKLKEACYLGHGVDFERFAAARPPEGPPLDPPAELAGLPRPLVGFYGALDSYTVDLDLMVQVARRVRPGTLLVIGPHAMDVSRMEREPNVRLLPPVPYAVIPQYAAQFDVGIMPWLQNEWIRNCNPIKLKEYLALGFPVVSIDFAELEPYRGLVHTAESRAGFLAALDRALDERGPALSASRKRAVCRDSWDCLAERAGRLLGVPARELSGARKQGGPL